MSQNLKEKYKSQLIKVGVPLFKAEQAAQTLTLEQLKIIGEIWPDWAKILDLEHQNTKLGTK